MTRFSDLCDCITDHCDPATSGASAYVGLEHIPGGAFRLVNFGRPSDVRSAKNRFRRGDILYGKLRPYLDKAVLASTDGICSTDILVLRPKSTVNAIYLLGLVHSESFVAHAVSTTNGVNHPRTSWDSLSSFTSGAPAKPEQDRIGAVLWKVQRAIEIEDKLITTSRELKQAAMRQLFTRGLRGERQKETEIGPVPESWEIATIGERCGRPQYGVTASATNEPVGPKFLRITDITDSGVNWSTVPYCSCSDEDAHAKALKEDDILVARIGATTGKSHIVKEPPEAVFASYLIRVRPGPGIDPDYMYYFLNSEPYWAQVNANKGNNLKGGVSGSILAGLKFPVPEIDEQKEIGRILFAIDRKIAVHERRRGTLQDLFNTLLHELMTGRIRVADLGIDVSEVTAA